MVAAKFGVKPTWIYNRLRYGLIRRWCKIASSIVAAGQSWV
jgi:hypothetical protein